MTTASYPLRIPEEIINLSKIKAREEHLDQTTALKQFLHTGAEKYVLELISEGRLSIGKAAERLKINIYDIYRIAQKHGVQLGATIEQARKSRDIAKKILK